MSGSVAGLSLVVPEDVWRTGSSTVTHLLVDAVESTFRGPVKLPDDARGGPKALSTLLCNNETHNVYFQLKI